MNDIKKVLVLFKTHLDIGFTDFAANVVDLYMKSYIPSAVRTAKLLRESGKVDEARLIWTTGSWLIWEYLRTHDGEEAEAVRQAIELGDISWHGLPFTSHIELMTSDLFEYGISLSQELDREFGKKTIGSKLTDVNGHTRAIIPYMKKAGIEFLHVGINPANRSDVPPLFRWKGLNGELMNVMYQHAYGEFCRIGNSDTAMYFAHTNDNMGVQSAETIVQLFDSLREKMPGAEIVAADLNDLALAVREIEDTLPIVDGEIGDTWVGSTPSDPKKMSHFRALEKLYAELPKGEDKEALARGLVMVPEHTWGMDIKTHLADHHHFKRDELAEMRKTAKNYQKVEASWQEQRNYIYDAVAEMSVENRAKAELLMSEASREEACVDGMEKMEIGKRFVFGDFVLSFNRQGELNYLEKNGRVIASRGYRLFSLVYQQNCADQYKRGQDNITLDEWWVWEDSSKIGMEEAVDCQRRYEPLSAEVYASTEKVVVIYAFPEDAYEKMGCPRRFDMIITEENGELHFDLAWFDKAANRVTEIISVCFRPESVFRGVRKLGQVIDPRTIVLGGQQGTYATDYGIIYDDMSIESLDAAVVTADNPVRMNYYTSKEVWDREWDHNRVYFKLFSNSAATNFPAWYDEDARFRFVLHLD